MTTPEDFINNLPDREKQSLLLLMDGMCGKQAAAVMNIHPHTVTTQWARVRRKALKHNLALRIRLVKI
jgi:FixJ family two-component response regulator